MTKIVFHLLTNVELKSVSFVSLGLVSMGCEFIIVSKFCSVGDASGDFFIFSVMFVNVNV